MFGLADDAGVLLDSDVNDMIRHGFPDGDDAFDASLGLFGVLEVILGRRQSGEPPTRRSPILRAGFSVKRHERYPQR